MLLPTIGAVLIIAGSASGWLVGASRPLASPPCQYVGDRSYAFYLWHFPVLIIAADAAGRTLPLHTNLLLLAGAFGLSIVTYALCENPMRHARWLRGRRTLALGGVALGAAALSFALPLAAISAHERALAAQGVVVARLTPAAGHAVETNIVDPPAIPAVRTAVSAARAHARVPSTLTPTLADAFLDYWAPPAACVPTYPNGLTSQQICHMGDVSSPRTVVLFGDSHAQMWGPPLLHAAEQLHMDVVPMLHPGCLLQSLAHGPEFDRYGKSQANCPGWYAWARTQIAALHPVAVFVGFRWDYFPSSADGFVVARLRTILDQLPHAILIADTPSGFEESVTCLSKGNATMASCSTHLKPKVTGLLTQIAGMARLSDHPVIATIQWFCSQGLCPMVVNNTIVHRDADHLTTVYSQELDPLFLPEARAALKQLHAP